MNHAELLKALENGTDYLDINASHKLDEAFDSNPNEKHLVLDENGENVERACWKKINDGFGIYVDDCDGYEIMPTSLLERL